MKIDERAVGMFEDDLFSLRMIGEFYGVSATGVKGYLNRRGVDTSKKRLTIVCDQCGVEFLKHRCQVRLSIKNYCSVGCYYESIHYPEYMVNRHSCREAHGVIFDCGYKVVSPAVVHHIDGNEMNNDSVNLMVFKDQSDHMRWHRAGHEKSGVVPVWPIVKINSVNGLKGRLRELSTVEKKKHLISEKKSTLRDSGQVELDRDREELVRKKGETNAQWQIRKRVWQNANSD